MAVGERNQMSLRLPLTLMDRLTRVCDFRGQTKQTFVQDVVEKAIHEIENPRAPFVRKGNEDGDEEVREGLGLAQLLRPAVGASQESFAPTPPTVAPVVVNVGGSSAETSASGSPRSDIDRLALYVVKGEEITRGMRLRTAIDIFVETSSTDEERKVLVARLEEAIAIKAKTAAVSLEDRVAKTARYAFDKFADLLKGE